MIFTGELYKFKGSRLGDNFHDKGKELISTNSVIPPNEARVFATFMAGFQTVPYKYLAIGSGTPTLFKNGEVPNAKDIIETYFINNGDKKPQLFSEFFRKEFTRTSFINPDGDYTMEPQTKISLVWTLGADEALGTWREIGIFSGDATDNLNSGVLVRYLTMEPFVKSKLDHKDDEINYEWILSLHNEG